MEIDSTVPPSESGSCICQQCRCQAEDPYVADMLKVADDSIALLCKQVHDLTNEKQGSEGKVKSLRKQVCCVFEWTDILVSWIAIFDKVITSQESFGIWHHNGHVTLPMSCDTSWRETGGSSWLTSRFRAGIVRWMFIACLIFLPKSFGIQ